MRPTIISNVSNDSIFQVDYPYFYIFDNTVEMNFTHESPHYSQQSILYIYHMFNFLALCPIRKIHRPKFCVVNTSSFIVSAVFSYFNLPANFRHIDISFGICLPEQQFDGPMHIKTTTLFLKLLMDLTVLSQYTYIVKSCYFTRYCNCGSLQHADY